MRRFSRGSTSNRNSASGSTSGTKTAGGSSDPYTTPPLNSHNAAPNGSAFAPAHASAGHNINKSESPRPLSQASNSSFDFMNRPVSGTHQQGVQMPSSAIGGLSRTDQVVLRYFWEDKYKENGQRDLHFLKFPFFGQYPSHGDLLPYCEIYHLVKQTPGASIISLGSANGVFIGFELAQGAQLHIDMDDEWREISHHRVIFKPYDQMLRDPTSDATFKTWPKPLTIEFLEDQYRKWLGDLTSFCWVDEPVRELGGSATGTNGNGGQVGVTGGLSDHDKSDGGL